MTEIHPTPEAGACTVRPVITYTGRDAANDCVDVAIVSFDFVVESAVVCLVRNRRTREVNTRLACSLSDGVAIMEAWLGGPVPL